MKTIITESAFVDTFDIFDRKENFTREARRALFEYFEQFEEDTGEEIEFDCIAICCEYNQMEYLEVASEYNIDISECSDDDEIKVAVLEHLNDNTSIVAELSDSVVFAAF